MKTRIAKNLRIAAVLGFYLLACSKSNDPKTGPQNCSNTKLVVNVAGSTAPTKCEAQDGSITLSVSGGTEPYSYFVNTGSTVINQVDPVFSALFPGVMKIIVKDKFLCTSSEMSFDLRLPTDSGISYGAIIVPILTANCNITSCHNGTLGSDRDWRSLSAIQGKLNNIQRVLALGRMPPPPNSLLTDTERNAILCWIADGAPNN